MNLTKLQFSAVFFIGILALALGGQNPPEIPEGDARTTVSKSEVIEIAQLVAKSVVTQRFDAQYRCTVNQYYGATDRCEECSLLCEPPANKKMCSLECPAVYARLYLAEPINTTVKALEAKVSAQEKELHQLKQAFDDYRRYQNEKDASQDRHLLILLCFVVAIIVASLVVAGYLLGGWIFRKRNSKEKGGFSGSSSVASGSRNDLVPSKDPEKGSLSNEDEISVKSSKQDSLEHDKTNEVLFKNQESNTEQQSLLKGIPPQNNREEEHSIQGPSHIAHPTSGDKNEKHPLTIIN